VAPTPKGKGKKKKSGKNRLAANAARAAAKYGKSPQDKHK
jgi:hypothetical protein